MTARRFSEDTKRDYVRNVKKFATFLDRSPGTATSEDLRRFQLHMAQQQASPSTINAAITALRFFFTVTLEKPDLVRPLRIVTEPRKAPVVLSQEEVARLLQAAPSLKYKAALSVAYGAGLRVSEVAHLKVSDIDSQRMMLRVEQGKGQRDRDVMLSPQLLQLLREWWKAARPQVWLFPGQNPINPVRRCPKTIASFRETSARCCSSILDEIISGHVQVAISTVRDLDARWIGVAIEFAADFETGFRRGVGDQFDDDEEAEEWRSRASSA